MANRKIKWQQFPLARPVLALVAGGFLYTLLPPLEAPLSIFLIACLLLLWFTYRKGTLLWPYTLYVVFLVLGYIHFKNVDESFHSHVTEDKIPAQQLSLKIKKCQWDESHERWKIYGRAILPSLSKPLGVYAWLPDTTSLQAEDMLLVKGQLKKVKDSPFPGGFDFADFLKKRRITHTLWIHHSQLLKIIRKPPEQQAFWKKWRAKQLADMKCQFSPATYGIYAAVLFGASEELDDRVRKNFADLGIAHILAVSGMHVGILVGILAFLIKWIFRRSGRKAIYLFIAVALGSFTYTMLCDFSSSASRASLMASIYYLARALKCSQSGLNSLSFSALILYMIDPYVIYDLGAQLSFTAMLGIFLLYPPLLEWCRWKLPLPNHLNSIIAISFAAQISLCPLLLFYFGKLPLLFWLFSIPAGYFAVFVFCSGWLWVIQNALFPGSDFWGDLLSSVVDHFIQMVEQASTSGNILLNVPFFNSSMFFILSGIVLYIGIWMYQKEYRQRKRSIIRITILFCLFLWYTSSQEQDVGIACFETRKQSIILIKVKKEAWALSQQPLSEYNYNALIESYPLDTIYSLPLSSQIVESIQEKGAISYLMNRKE